METHFDKLVVTRARWLFPLVLVVVSILLFTKTMGGAFVYDDLTMVVNNPDIKRWHFWDTWGLWGRGTRTLSLMVDYYLFGDNAAGYHVQNIFWHALSVLLLYLVFIKISNDFFLSFTASLLFAVHPIHVEAIANISNRKEMICMVFSLASFLFYFRFIDNIGIKRFSSFLGFSFFWYLALNSKEVAIVVPLLIVTYEYIFLPEKKRFLTRKTFLLKIGLLSVCFLIYWFIIKDMKITKGSYVGEFTTLSFLITTPKVILTYFNFLIFPINLSPEYVIKGYNTIADPILVLFWVATLGIFIFSFYLIRKMPLISYGILWFFITYLPVSSIVPSTHMVADRYMYIPSAGFCLLMAVSLQNLYNIFLRCLKKEYAGTVIITFLLTLLSLYSVLTIKYITVWKNRENLWEYAVKVSPMAPKTYFNRGQVYFNAGKYKESIKDFGEAIKINPYVADFYYSRGVSYLSLSNRNLAIRDFERAINLNPQFKSAYFGLGLTYSELGEKEKAYNYFKKAGAKSGHGTNIN